MENRKNLLVTLADKNYIQQAKQLFSSVYWNAGWSGDYMLLTHDIPEEELKWFHDKGILTKRCKLLYDGPMGNGNYSTAVLNKFYLFTEEFKKWEHVVFLDSDIIVRAPIDELIKTKAFSSPKTCKKYFIIYFSCSNDSKELTELKEEYGLKRLFKPAFNSGVISFNTRIIKDDTFDKLMTIFRKYAGICNGDDAILNLFFYDQWITLPLVYNVRINHFVLKKIYKAVILHFERPTRMSGDNSKPWDTASPYYEEWKTNLEKAEFIDSNKIQNVKKWENNTIMFYSLLLNMEIYTKNFFYLIHDKVIKDPFCFHYGLMPFFRYKLMPFLRYLIKTPDRTIGIIGAVIKKINPDLYNKLKKTGNKEVR